MCCAHEICWIYPSSGACSCDIPAPKQTDRPSRLLIMVIRWGLYVAPSPGSTALEGQTL